MIEQYIEETAFDQLFLQFVSCTALWGTKKWQGWREEEGVYILSVWSIHLLLMSCIQGSQKAGSQLLLSPLYV